jgi:hypothetical protein
MNSKLNRKIAELRGEGELSAYPPVGKLFSWPAYDTDWECAGVLLDEMVAAGEVELMRSGNGSRRAIRFYDDAAAGYQYSNGAKLTCAIALAWLAWKTRKQE